MTYVPPVSDHADVSWVGDDIYKRPIQAHAVQVSWVSARTELVFSHPVSDSLPVSLIFDEEDFGDTEPVVVRRWTGTEWVVAEVKRYSGSAWVTATPKRRTGSGWV